MSTVVRRWRPSPSQKACLESMFAAHHMPGTPDINHLAHALGLAPRQVRIWFQNKRQRTHVDKKKKQKPKKCFTAPKRPSPLSSPCTSATVPSSFSPSGSVSSRPCTPAHDRVDGGFFFLPASHVCIDMAAFVPAPPVGTYYQAREGQHEGVINAEAFGMSEKVDLCAEWDLTNIQIGELVDALGCC